MSFSPLRRTNQAKIDEGADGVEKEKAGERPRLPVREQNGRQQKSWQLSTGPHVW